MHRGTTRDASSTSSAVEYIGILDMANVGAQLTDMDGTVGTWT